MRKLVVALVLAGSLAIPVALAQSPFPEKIPLPNGFAPEGIETALGHRFFVGSVANGAIYTGNLRTGAIAASRGGRSHADHPRRNRHRVRPRPAVGRRGRLRHRPRLRRRHGRAAPRVPARHAAGTFINDVVVTQDAAYFTDSQRPVLYRVAISRNGVPGALTTIPLLSPDYVHVPGQFNLNGIVATPSGKTLIAVQTFSRKLFLINPSTGATKAIDIGTYDLINGDGLLLHGPTLYVVQNRSNKVAVFRLSPDLTKATFVRAITDPDFDVPTTIDRAGARLYVVNARFGTATPTDQHYDVVKAG